MPTKSRQQQNTNKDGKAKKSEANRLNAEMDAEAKKKEAKKKEVDRQEASSYYSCIWRKSW